MKRFLQYLREQAESPRVLHIMRGISGSGKSTLSQQIVSDAKENDHSHALLSTDRFFMKNGVYSFDPSKIVEHHGRNIEEAIQNMKNGTNHVIIDNTNLMHAHMKPYVEAAQKHGYEIKFHDIHDNDPDNIDVDLAAKRMTQRAQTIPGSDHGRVVAERQAASYQPFTTNNPIEEIMNS